MKLIKEAFMQSTELDAFVSQLQGRFNPYFNVTLTSGGRDMVNHFSTRDAAQEYFDGIRKNIKEKPENYINPSLSLEQINLTIDTEELNYFMPGEDDEEDYILYDDNIEGIEKEGE